MEKLFSILMAMIAYSCISAGFVMMKRGISWIGWKGEKTRKFYLNLAIWIIGFIIMNIYGVPSAVALKNLQAHIVVAFAGWGIILLVFLSKFFLKEEVYFSDYMFSLLIMLGIISVNIFNYTTKRGGYDWLLLFILSVLPLVLFVFGFLKTVSAKLRMSIYAGVSGAFAGLMVVFLGLLIEEHGYSISLYFKSEFLYLYLFYALMSFVALQMALKIGLLLLVGPIQYATNIIYPLIISSLVFKLNILPIQYIAIAMIIIGVFNILKRH